MGRDTIPDEFRREFIGNRVKAGKMTKQDSVDYFTKITAAPLVLMRDQIDGHAKKILKTQLERGDKMVSYLGKDTVLKIINSPTEQKGHPSRLLNAGILLVTKFPEKQTFHSFSRPFLIDENKYLIYHERLKGKAKIRDSGLSEFILYNLTDKNKIVIEKHFVLWEH